MLPAACDQVVRCQTGKCKLNFVCGDAHIWQGDWHVGDLCAAGVRELANAINRIVIVKGEQIAPVGKWIRLADEL